METTPLTSMQYDLQKSLEILERTPATYKSLFYGISPEWSLSNEGPKTWSAFDIIGHLIHGEQTDWIPRARIILSDAADKTFEPFDRFAQEKLSVGKTMDGLLDDFEALRMQNLEELKSWNLSEEDLEKKGIHPELGEVTLKQLLSVWTIHDLMHLHQVSRVMVKLYKEEIGPFIQYSGMLNK